MCNWAVIEMIDQLQTFFSITIIVTIIHIYKKNNYNYNYNYNWRISINYNYAINYIKKGSIIINYNYNYNWPQPWGQRFCNIVDWCHVLSLECFNAGI